jgi:hypothetical protein
MLSQWQTILYGAAIYFNCTMEVLQRHACKRSQNKHQFLPYHMSALSGEDGVEELIHGHPNFIKTELRMHLHIFKSLCTVLQTCGLKPSKHLSCAYVCLSDQGYYSLPTKISDNTKFSPFFDNAMGAIDGTHINCVPSIEK